MPLKIKFQLAHSILHMNLTNKMSSDELHTYLSGISGLERRSDIAGVSPLCYTVNGADFIATVTELKDKFGFDFLVDVTCVDYFDSKPVRFSVVYQLLSLSSNNRLTLHMPVCEDNPKAPSLTSLWKSALFLEREVWDMFGIVFEGHPDLRRILMYDEFVGHPLRKDYNILHKQPRVTMRLPELHNTAKDMHRETLVQLRGIGKDSATKQK